MSFPRELCTYGKCNKGGNIDTMLLGGCNKGGTIVESILHKFLFINLTPKGLRGPKWVAANMGHVITNCDLF
jgi:hypothetical protein